MNEPVLVMKQICKRFSSTIALDNVDLTVYPGEIRGLIGENGSGKSTIASIAVGMHKATSGEVLFHGKKWQPENMIQALDEGIGMVVQESGTIPGISVAENIFLGDLERFRKGPVINRKKLNEAAAAILAQVEMNNIDPAMPMAALDIQDRKLVEIAKVISKDPDIFIVDETTTALSQAGRNIIYKLMKRQKEAGKSVLFISHDLDELMEICDTLTVLRDGSLICSLGREEFSEERIKQLMVGRELSGDYYRSDYDPSCGEEVVLELVGGTNSRVKDMSLKVHSGEIVGIGGLSHCGMHTLGKVLFGAEKLASGKVVVKGETLKNESHAMQCGVGYVSKNRDTESLDLGASIKDNISVAGLDKFAVGKGLIFRKKEKDYVNKQIKDLSIKCFDMKQDTSQLSGGNKQKVVFGKWVGRNCDVLILDCPTRGVDIGVKQFMYQLMYRLKQEGKSIILISEELSELIGMSDRLIIMKDGQISGEFTRSPELTDSAVIGCMI